MATTLEELGIDPSKPNFADQLKKREERLVAERELARQREDRLQRESLDRLSVQAHELKFAKPTQGISATCQICGESSTLYGNGIVERDSLRLAFFLDTSVGGNVLLYRCPKCEARNTILVGEVIHGSPAEYPGARALLAPPAPAPVTPPPAPALPTWKCPTQFGNLYAKGETAESAYDALDLEQRRKIAREKFIAIATQVQ